MINLGFRDHHAWNFQGFCASVLNGFLSIVDRTVYYHPLSDSVIFSWPLDLWLNKPVHSYICFWLPLFISVVPVYILSSLVPTLVVETKYKDDGMVSMWFSHVLSFKNTMLTQNQLFTCPFRFLWGIRIFIPKSLRQSNLFNPEIWMVKISGRPVQKMYWLKY